MRSSVLSVTLVAGLASASSSPSPTTGDKNAAAAASASAAKAQAAAKASIAAEIQAIAIYQAKAEAAHIQQILESMPKCATACLKNSTAHVGCNMTDIECQCGKLRPLVVDIAPCMIKLGCDMQQMITAGSTLFTLCLDAFNKTHNNSLPPLQQLMAEQANQTSTKTSASSQGYVAGWAGVAVALALAVTFV